MSGSSTARVRSLTVIAPAFPRVKRVTLTGRFHPRNCLRVTAPRGLDGRVGERVSWSHDFGVRVARPWSVTKVVTLALAKVVAFGLLVSLAPVSRAFAEGDPSSDSEATEYTRVIQDAVERFRVRDKRQGLLRRQHDLQDAGEPPQGGFEPRSQPLVGQRLYASVLDRNAAEVADIGEELAEGGVRGG